MHSPQQIVSEILPELQRNLGYAAVMAEASASAPSTVIHFDPAKPAATTPLVEPAIPQPTHTFDQKFEM